MGVSGSGKTTIGKLLADELQWPFYDADDFHPEKNKDLMRDGLPLTDNHRMPWLETLRDRLENWSRKGNAVLACSALKESYRTVLKEKVPDVKVVFLHGSKKVIEKRILERTGHYMKAAMLDSQLEILEPPGYGITIDISNTPSAIIKTIRKELNV
jgi:carbohydrate kinase (thermoresistant glucokinase family)